ncbi:MAG TPA: hypothetical protein VKC61_01395 [Pyrinomonadaceae bacterium]|nr:hypothetical protein [Pyrinomonadaceae bacterium]
MRLLLRLEGFNIAIGVDGHAIPAFANIDPPRMFQLQLAPLFRNQFSKFK